MKKLSTWVLCILLFLFLMPAAFAEGNWVCPSCNSENDPSNYCVYCGKENPHKESAANPANHSHVLISFGEARDATCLEYGLTRGIQCSECGEILAEQTIQPKTGHEWKPATCLKPMTCAVCGTTQGTTGEHSWKTTGTLTICDICGENRSRLYGVYLNELPWVKKNCKFYHWSAEPVSVPNNLKWSDTNTIGYIPSADDIWGNVYQYGMHLDSGDKGPYWILYNLSGKYTRLTGTIAPPVASAEGTLAPAYEYNEYYKYIKIYLDGNEIYTSPRMTPFSQPALINEDITGGRSLRIEYSGSGYSNEIAVLFDAMLQ